MCEIAIVDPKEYSLNMLANKIMEIYHGQRSSLGLVAVHHEESRDRFHYETFKRVEPNIHEVSAFCENNDDAGWLIIHGRLATTGEVTKQNAHPLEIECSECSIDYVLHNGIVSRHGEDRDNLEQLGHSFSTNVDSEVLGHFHGEIPDLEADTLEDIDPYIQPAYILLGDDGMFIYAQNGYELTEDGMLARTYRKAFRQYSEANYRAVVLKA